MLLFAVLALLGRVATFALLGRVATFALLGRVADSLFHKVIHYIPKGR